MNNNYAEHLLRQKYNKMSDEEKRDFAKKTKSGAIFATTLLSCIELTFLVLSIYSFCVKNGNGVMWISMFVGGAIALSIFLSRYKFLALHSDEEWIIYELGYRIKQAAKLRRKGKATLKHILLLHASDIISVSLIDKFTEVTDKLHGFLNYQEIIQTRYYKFKIEFEENDFEIFQTKENSSDCSYLLSLIK